MVSQISKTAARRFKRFGCVMALYATALTMVAAESPAIENFRAVQQAAAVIGLEVRDLQDRQLGIVKDLALDLENGRLVEVIVSSGGFLGMGKRTVAVPPSALMFDRSNGVFRLNMAPEKFKAAPAFAMSKWAEHCQSRNVAEAYRYYGQAPYFAADGQNSLSGNTATEPLGYIQRSSKLLDLQVVNLQNEPLGRVNAFLYDLASGRVIHVIVRVPEYRQTKNVIPARALRFNASHDTLFFDVSTTAFQNEPRFKWAYGFYPKDTYANYQQENYSNTKVAANAGVNTLQNVREGTADTYIPLAQGTSYADVDKTRRIYAEMRADTSLSQNAQNVEVGTLDARVTLRGHVDTEEGKRAIGEIASRAGRPENVSNLLEVKPLPATSR